MSRGENRGTHRGTGARDVAEKPAAIAPVRKTARDFESGASANSATPAPRRHILPRVDYGATRGDRGQRTSRRASMTERVLSMLANTLSVGLASLENSEGGT